MPKKTTTKTATANTSWNYFLSDYRHTIYPLSTTKLLIERGTEEFTDHIYKRILNKSHQEHHFLPQQRCYGAKRSYHLRRTVKLDPMAEFFIYDVVYRNRKSFRTDHRENRLSFGYRFKSGVAESPAEAFGSFKSAVLAARKKYKFTLSVDVATYFNSIYHHDLVNSVREIGWPDVDVDAIGQYLREINSGRSIDCLPHGLHPCKVLGSEFLRFVDNSFKLKSDLTLRFLDDIHLFSDSKDSLTADLITIQILLGEKGLSLNDSKTIEGPSEHLDMQTTIDDIKYDLLAIRRDKVIGSGGWVEFEENNNNEEEDDALSSEHVDYLLALINSPDVQEEDAELVFSLLRNHEREVYPKMIEVLRRFPGLTKNVYNYTRLATDREELDDLILNFLDDSPLATEYQLFWLAKLTEDFLNKSPKIGDIYIKAFEHQNATVISRAKILEIPDKRFGLQELRDERLRTGRSDWEAWSSAAGSRVLKPAARSHLLSYFANASQINWVISENLRKIDN